MIKLVTGMIIGSVLTLSVTQLYGTSSHVSQQTTQSDQGYASGLYNRAIEPYYSHSLGEDPNKARLYNDPALRKLTLVEQRSLLQLDQSAIERICFRPVSAGGEAVASVNVSIELTAEAKAMIGDTLTPYEGRAFAFQFLDTPLATFVLSEERRRLFANDTDIEFEDADFEYSFRPDALLQGLLYAYEIAGPDKVTMCDDGYSFDDLPNFKTVLPHAEQAYVYWHEGPAEEAFRQNRQDE